MNLHDNISNEQLCHLDAVCDRFLTAWQSGELPRIEDFLTDCGSVPKAVLIRELLATEMELLIRNGQPVPLDDYLERFTYPGLVDALYRQVVKDASATPASNGSEIRKLPQLRDYQLLHKVGEGGFGGVYKAVHTRLGKHFAIKILPAEKLADPTIVARFQREMKAVGALEHPNIVRATDAGEIDGCHFLVMEFVDGVTMSELVDNCGPLPIREACEIVRQAAIALDFAHANGLVHRDVKPSNLMLSGIINKSEVSNRTRPRTETTDKTEAISPSHHLGDAPPSKPSGSWVQSPVVKLLDLGLARLRGRVDALTADGQVIGTMDYMAPEQARRGGDVGPQADIYSLGCTLFALLTARAPFGDAEHLSAAQKILAHVEEPLPQLEVLRPDAPRQLINILNRMTAKKPEQRYATAAAVAEAMAPLAAGANLFSLQASKPAAKRTSSASQLDPTLVYEPAETAVSDRWSLKFMVPAGAMILGLFVGVPLLLGWNPWSRVATLSSDSAHVPASLDLDHSPVNSAASGYALAFDGVSSHVSIPTLRRDDPGPVTIEAWAERVPQLGSKLIVTLGGKAWCGLAVSDQNWFCGDPSLEKGFVDTPQAAGLVHLAYVRDEQEGRFYLNGTEVDRSPRTKDRTSGTKDMQAWLGAGLEGNMLVYHFQGQIHEVRISQVARYSGTFTPDSRFESDDDTLALYHCDEGQGGVLHDASRNAHHGEIIRATWVKTSDTQ